MYTYFIYIYYVLYFIWLISQTYMVGLIISIMESYIDTPNRDIDIRILLVTSLSVANLYRIQECVKVAVKRLYLSRWQD